MFNKINFLFENNRKKLITGNVTCLLNIKYRRLGTFLYLN